MVKQIIPDAAADTGFKGLQISTVPIYCMNPAVTKDDVMEYLQARLGHLSSMLAMVGEEHFKTFSDQVQDDFHWSCRLVADECHALSTELLTRTFGQDLSDFDSRR